MATDLEWLAHPMRPASLVRETDEYIPNALRDGDERIRARYEQYCRKVVVEASKSLEEYRQSLKKSLANPVKFWNFRAWMERRFEDDLDRWGIYYEEARIRKAMLALSEKELSKT